MIGWRRKRRPVQGRVETLVGRHTRVTGDLLFLGGLHCDGQIVGSVRAEDEADSVLTLSVHGSIRGELRAPYIRIDGQVTGDVYASQRIELGPHARIQGDVHYTLLEMAVGAEVNGQLRHVSERRGRDPLALMGVAEIQDPARLGTSARPQSEE